jgi:predicted nucleic acid-binding protein
MVANPAVYIDACCFIDCVKFDVSAPIEEGREKEVWYVKKLLQAHRDKELTVYTSTLSIAEAVHIGSSPVPESVQRALDALLTSGQYVHLVQPTPFVCIDARNLRWVENINLRGADSIHLASALEMKCLEFLSTDTRFARLSKFSPQITAKGITPKLPSQTSVLPGKYLQGDFLDSGQMH